MNEPADTWSLVRGATADTLGDARRLARAVVVLFTVAVSFAFVWVGLSAATGRVPSDLRTPLAVTISLVVFGFMDALFVYSIHTDRPLFDGLDRVGANGAGVALWIGAFVVSFWWIMTALVPQLALPTAVGGAESVAGSPLATSFVVCFGVLVSATFAVPALTMLELWGPADAAAGALEHLTETPAETAIAVLLGVATVTVGTLVLAVGFFSLVLAPIGVFVLAVAYTFARSLAVRTYYRGRNRLRDDGRDLRVSRPDGHR